MLSGCQRRAGLFCKVCNMAKSSNKPAAPAPVAKAPTVALRGGQAVALVSLRAGATYKTKAPHNQQWWASITQACGEGKAAPVADLVKPAPAGPGVPAHFVGYCLRRGYLVGTN